MGYKPYCFDMGIQPCLYSVEILIKLHRLLRSQCALLRLVNFQCSAEYELEVVA